MSQTLCGESPLIINTGSLAWLLGVKQHNFHSKLQCEVFLIFNMKEAVRLWTRRKLKHINSAYSWYSPCLFCLPSSFIYFGMLTARSLDSPQLTCSVPLPPPHGEHTKGSGDRYLQATVGGETFRKTEQERSMQRKDYTTDGRSKSTRDSFFNLQASMSDHRQDKDHSDVHSTQTPAD